MCLYMSVDKIIFSKKILTTVDILLVTSGISSDLVYKQGHVLLHWGFTLLQPNTGIKMVDRRLSWYRVPGRSPTAALETPRSTRATAVLASPPSWDLVAAVCRSEIVLCPCGEVSLPGSWQSAQDPGDAFSRLATRCVFSEEAGSSMGLTLQPLLL